MKRPDEPRDSNPATADATRLLEEVVPLVNQAKGMSWYETYGSDTEFAVIGLCRLRRAAAGDGSNVERGDEAVRAALEQAEPEAVIWLASRAISYMDEQGYPESIERLFG